MIATDRVDTSVENQAATLLSAALAQVNEIKRALALTRDPRLASARDQTLDIVSEIRAAMQSGNLTVSSLASLAASISIGGDAASLVAQSESAAVAAKLELARASIESHLSVERMSVDLFDRHEFDGDVARHTHGTELEAFKRREAEDQKYIRDQLARRTAEGDLNASGRTQGFMLDANAYGAGDNPDFVKKWVELKTKTDRLRESLRATGRSTEEYDQHIREDVIAFLKAKGLADELIGDALAKSKDPIDAVEQYLGRGTETAKLANDIQLSAGPKSTSVMTVVADGIAEQQPLVIDVDAMNARLAAAGLDTSPKDPERTGHGLTIQKQRTPGAILR